jgi:O-antigen ligase
MQLQTTRPNWFGPVLIGIAIAILAVTAGALLGYTNILITVIVFAGLAVALWALTDLEIGLWGMVAIIALLPFGALPIKIVFTPTFLDLAMGGVLLVYALQWMSGRRRRLTVTPAHAPILAFIVMAVFTFVAGLNNGPLTSNLIRHFAEFVLSIAFSFVIVDWVEDRERLERLVIIIVLCGTAAALLGIVLYLIPEDLAERVLSSLRVVGYPSGGVLQYIEANPELGQRAIGTSVNPNAFGGLLAIVGALVAPQVTAPRPAFGPHWRGIWGISFLIIGICLILTFSRTAMAGLALGIFCAALASPRYRVWTVLLVMGGLVIAMLPWTQEYVDRFIQGAQGADLATQMRFGEYKDALILLSRYPLIGVGFAGAPDIDIYLGVSNAYLSIAQQMGFIGLGLLLLVLLVVFAWAFDRRRAARNDPQLEPLYLGLHAALIAVLTVGIGDHYFVNLDFQPAQTLFWMIIGLALSATRLSHLVDQTESVSNTALV